MQPAPLNRAVRVSRSRFRSRKIASGAVACDGGAAGRLLVGETGEVIRRATRSVAVAGERARG